MTLLTIARRTELVDGFESVLHRCGIDSLRELAMDCIGFSFAVLRNSFLGLAAPGVFGCGSKPAFQAAPSPTVIVAKPVKREIVEWEYFTAQTQAIDTVTISPRVTGYIDSILFKEGDVVNSGDLLYVIDPRPYQAALDQAKGQLEQALAQQKLDNANLERSKDLLAKRVIA